MLRVFHVHAAQCRANRLDQDPDIQCRRPLGDVAQVQPGAATRRSSLAVVEPGDPRLTSMRRRARVRRASSGADGRGPTRRIEPPSTLNSSEARRGRAAEGCRPTRCRRRRSRGPERQQVNSGPRARPRRRRSRAAAAVAAHGHREPSRSGADETSTRSAPRRSIVSLAPARGPRVPGGPPAAAGRPSTPADRTRGPAAAQPANGRRAAPCDCSRGPARAAGAYRRPAR